MPVKKCLNDLAILGGSPAFEHKLHVGCPNVGNRDRFLERINDILNRRWLTNNGPYVLELERKIAEANGVGHCIAICNGTIALDITIKALDLSGEVIIPSFTFISTAHALQWHGITPVFCDVEPNTHNIDPRHVEKLITARTSAIIGVHLWGRPCDIDALTEIAHQYKLKLLFDAAHAYGVSYKGRMIGTFGDAEIFSFHATKFLNTLEGGAVLTNDDQLANKIRLMKNFGFKGYDNVVSIGINGKMDEMSAAMGLTLMENLEDLICINRRNYMHYLQELSNLQGVGLLSYNENEKCNYQYIVLDVDDQLIGITRDRMVEILHAENILARRYFHPGCHRMEPYCSNLTFFRSELPVTEALTKRLISLPTGSAVTTSEISQICDNIRYIINNGQEISTILSLRGQSNDLQRSST